MDPQELKPLDEFSEPVCRYESTGTITNSLEQKLEIKVRGQDQDLVEAYMKNVRISFVALSEEENVGTWEEKPEKLDDRLQALIDEELKSLELHPELGLEIELDVIETQGLELPYDLNIEIDPPISSGEPHNYITKKKCSKEKVTLKVTENGVIGFLSGPSDSDRNQADRFDNTPFSDTARLRAEEPNASDFTFTVTGLRANNTYTQNASMKLVRT